MPLTILTGSSQAAGVNYSYSTSGSADWASVPTASYFYDIIDRTVRYRSVNGDIQRFDAFPYTGSALITGSLGVTGSLTATQIGVGAASSGSIRLDVRAQGSLSTDIAFRVRNSANTDNMLTVNGDGTQTWLAPANNALNTIRSGTNNLIQWGNENFGNIAIGYNSSNMIVPTTAYNTILGANASSGASSTFTVGIGWGSIVNSTAGIVIGRTRVNGNYTIKIGYDGGASQYGGENSIHIGRTTSGNDVAVDNVFMTYFNSQNPSTLARVNGSFGLLGQQAVILNNGTGANGLNTFMGNGGNTLVIATHPSLPSSSITTAFQLYASTGSIASNIRPHFRTSNDTIVWLGDESRLFNVTASNITASNITAASLTIPSGSITLTTGSITMPNRPAFRVTGAGGGKTAVTTLSGSYLNVDYQQGGGWDNSTGTFTAPIAGLYQVNLVTRTNSNSLGTISQLIVYKNNTGGTTGTPQVMIEYGINTSMNHVGGSTISKLAVGDTLKMVVAVGEISFDQNDNFSVAYIG